MTAVSAQFRVAQVFAILDVEAAQGPVFMIVSLVNLDILCTIVFVYLSVLI